MVDTGRAPDAGPIIAAMTIAATEACTLAQVAVAVPEVVTRVVVDANGRVCSVGTWASVSSRCAS